MQSTDESSRDQVHPEDSRIPFGDSVIFVKLGVLVIGIWLLLGPVSNFILRRFFVEATPEQLGQIGDWHGLTNSLFAALAFAGVIGALLLQLRAINLQQRELKLQREELILARQEFKRSAEAQEASTRELRRQVQAPIVLELMRDMRSEEMRAALMGLTGWAKTNHAIESDVQGKPRQFHWQFTKFKMGSEQSVVARDGKHISLDDVDRWRRLLSKYCYTVYRLYDIGAIDLALARVLIREDMSATAIAIVEPLDEIVRANYERAGFDFICSLYPCEDVIKKGFYSWMTALEPDVRARYGRLDSI